MGNCERRVRDPKHRVQLKGPFGARLDKALYLRRFVRSYSADTQQRKVAPRGPRRMRKREIGIGLDGLIEKEVTGGATERRQRPEVILVRLGGLGRRPLDTRLFLERELSLERVGDVHRDVRLHRKDRAQVAQIPWIGVRPQVAVSLGIDELRRHHDGVTGVAHTAFHHRTHVQLLCDLGNGRRRIGVLQHGSPGDDIQIADLDELVQNLIVNALCEIRVVRVGAQVVTK